MSKTHPKHVIVITGATSGIGAQAVKQLAASPYTLVLTGVRGKGRTVPGAEIFPLDLASRFAHLSSALVGGLPRADLRDTSVLRVPSHSFQGRTNGWAGPDQKSRSGQQSVLPGGRTRTSAPPGRSGLSR